MSVVFTTGGLPPLVSHPDEVYTHLFSTLPLFPTSYPTPEQRTEKVKERNKAYYAKYAEDVSRVKTIIRYLQDKTVHLPAGGILSVLRLRQLGFFFGFHGTMDTVHGNLHILQISSLLSTNTHTLKEMICRLTADLTHFGFFTRSTLTEFEGMLPFDTMPLYALLHEPIYARE